MIPKWGLPRMGVPKKLMLYSRKSHYKMHDLGAVLVLETFKWVYLSYVQVFEIIKHLQKKNEFICIFAIKRRVSIEFALYNCELVIYLCPRFCEPHSSECPSCNEQIVWGLARAIINCRRPTRCLRWQNISTHTLDYVILNPIHPW